MRVRDEEGYQRKKAAIMEACFDCYAEHGLNSTGAKALAAACGCSPAALYTYFGSLDELIVQSTAHCMAKVEAEFLDRAPRSLAELERYLEETPRWAARRHGKRCRLMYQVYTHPRYMQSGKEYFEGAKSRFAERTGELKLEEAEAAVAQARELLEQVAALPDDQRAVVSSGLVDNAEQVVERGTALIEEAAAKKAAADAKAANKVKSKSFSVKAGKKKVIYFKTTSSSVGTRVTFKKASGSKYISVTKAGKVTAKKGMRAGKKYTARVKVTCGATTRTVKITVRAR